MAPSGAPFAFYIVNFQNIQSAVNNAASAVSAAIDFSRWEAVAPSEPQINDLGFTGEQIQSITSTQPYGLSETLKASFPHLVRRNGKLGSLLRFSFAFEHLGRDCSFDQLAQVLSCSCNTAYQSAIKLQKAYESAFGIRLTVTSDGVHLTESTELALRASRLVKNALALEAQARKLAAEAVSIERVSGQNLLGSATQNLLQAVLNPELRSEQEHYS